MALLDAIIWHDDDFSRGIARWDIRHDDFWVRGHFPDRPMLPGVLQVEAAAQLSAYLYNRYSGSRATAAFLRIENAVFRRIVEPGQRFYLLSVGQKRSARRFITEVQGVVDGQLAFEAVIHGMRLDGRTDQGALAQRGKDSPK
jgi:3-hydroxyacyl-[acyl-carrier-protein] dehydratase